MNRAYLRSLLSTVTLRVTKPVPGGNSLVERRTDAPVVQPMESRIRMTANIAMVQCRSGRIWSLHVLPTEGIGQNGRGMNQRGDSAKSNKFYEREAETRQIRPPPNWASDL